MVLKRIKKLEVVHSKFATKSNYVTKTNILRKTLLPFLRASNSLELVENCDVQVQRSLASVLTSILLRWWSSLLGSVALTSLVTSTDRNAYLEGISRIISRSEWFSSDKETLHQYRQLLVSTLDYVISRLLSLKLTLLAFLAFAGKVFAYGFFHIPKVSNALLFLLNVRVSVLKRSEVKPTSKNESMVLFPAPVQPWVNYSGINVPKNSHHLNSMPPPRHPVDGIRDPNGTWVHRWCSSDSDIFNSFLRHYLSVCLHYVDEDFDSIALPGFQIILGHIFQIFETSINRMAMANSERPTDRPNNMNRDPAKTNLASPILKILKTFRYLTVSDISFRYSLCRKVDGLLVAIARTSSVYDYHKNAVILNVAHEIVHQVGQDINWEFWLGCIYMMLHNTDHAQTLLKGFSFLFNVWDRIPETLPTCEDTSAPHLKWLQDLNESFKENFVNWLISDQCWERFFIHWNGLVSSYYIRLLVWRVIGINNFESSIAIQTTKKVESRVRKSHDMLLAHDNDCTYYKPDSPLGSRKLGIVPVNVKDEFYLAGEVSTAPVISTPSEIRKTHPYEIFDEAVYSCSSLPVTPTLVIERSSSSSSIKDKSSLVTSIGKLFKMLSTEEPKKPPQLRNNRNSVSLTSLSTSYSIMSQSSSPSVMSYKSTPTSNTDNSTEDSDISSISTELWSPNDEQTQPPELFNKVPEVVRPVIKFELIVDHDSLSNRFSIMKMQTPRVPFERCVPDVPEIPTISIFVRDDPYDKLYLSQENDLMILNDFESTEKSLVYENLSPNDRAKWEKLGKRLNEWNAVVEEFEKYMIHRVETDQLNSKINAPLAGAWSTEDINETDYFKKIVPFLLVEEANDLKMNGG